MRSSLKNTRAGQLIGRISDAVNYVIDRLTWGLFGGLFMLTISVSAQDLEPYKLLIKGERSPYDSAVAIELPTYRFETDKLQLGDQLIDSLVVEIDSLRGEARLAGIVIDSQEHIIDIQVKTINRTDSTLDRIDENYKALVAVVTAPDPWYERVPGWIIASLAFIAGVLIAK
jgi:hypothetical protein